MAGGSSRSRPRKGQRGKLEDAAAARYELESTDESVTSDTPEQTDLQTGAVVSLDSPALTLQGPFLEVRTAAPEMATRAKTTRRNQQILGSRGGGGVLPVPKPPSTGTASFRSTVSVQPKLTGEAEHLFSSRSVISVSSDSEV